MVEQRSTVGVGVTGESFKGPLLNGLKEEWNRLRKGHQQKQDIIEVGARDNDFLFASESNREKHI